MGFTGNIYGFPTDLNLESLYMPVPLNLKSSFFGVASLMHARIAFVAGFLTHYLSQRETLPLETIAVETAALRTEIKTARESVQELQLGQDSCVWRLWVQQWLLRLSLTSCWWCGLFGNIEFTRHSDHRILWRSKIFKF